MTVAETFGEFVADAGRSEPGANVIRHATRALVDWSGTVFAGWQTPFAELLLRPLSRELGTGPARVYSSPPLASWPRTAALLNSAVSHSIEMDDIYSPALYHPGCPTIAAALAVAEATGASGRDLLRAIAIGYDVGNRIGRAIQPSHYRYWHTTGTVGGFGAAAAAAALLRLDARQTAHALATVATFAAGLQQAFRSDAMSKPLHAGRAAEAGVLAAEGAQAGLTGALDILEGEAGFAAAMSQGAQWNQAFDGLGASWTIEEITFKNHACCSHAFAAIDGALVLRPQIDDVSRIEQIIVETYTTATEVAGIAQPDTPYEAKFSTAFAVATALLFGRVRLDAFTHDRLHDAGIKALMPRVSLVGSAAYDQAFPAMRGATVRILLRNGLELRHEQPTRRGSPTFPMSNDELADKFRELAEPALKCQTEATLTRLERAADATAFRLMP